MKGMRTLLAAALLAAPLAGCSNKSSPPPPPSPKAVAATPWQEFSSAKGKFSVLMPGTPKEIVQDLPTDLGKLKQTAYAVERPNMSEVFAVVFADYPANARYGDETFDHNVLDGVIDGAARTRKAQVQSKTKIKLGDHHGQECVMDLAESKRKSLWRAYLVKNRLFQVACDWPAQLGDVCRPDAEKFMDSFKLTQ